TDFVISLHKRAGRRNWRLSCASLVVSEGVGRPPTAWPAKRAQRSSVSMLTVCTEARRTMNLSTLRNWKLFAVLLVAAPAAFAQTPSTLTADDQAAIQSLVASYAKALGGCHAEEFADLFVPETGSFASGFRGRMVGHDKLIALVQSERHCIAPA